MSTFIFNSGYKLNYVNDNYNYNFKNDKIFTLDEECLKALKSNHRQEYIDIAERYNDKKQIFNIEPYANDYIILHNSLVNNNGIIIKDDKVYVNGGCLCRNNDYYFDKNVNVITDVISITALWCEGIWHFPFEAFVALMSIPKDILFKYKIHVSQISNYVIQWFKFLNIPSSQLISGSIYAQNLYIPRMGKCGSPYYNQMIWLQNIVKTNITEMPCEYVILIKRNNVRKLKNYDKLESILTNFCKTSCLKLYIHDDNNLPLLLEQHKIFNKAKIVFAPHGAGGINIISMKNDSWYIEFLPIECINVCYSRLAYLYNINYKGIAMKDFTIDLKKIENILKELKMFENIL